MIPLQNSQISYGGDYHPELWPEAVWAEDAALMQRAGVNLVTLGERIWHRLQPDPDSFTFDWLDRVLDLLHRHEIHVNLSTTTSTPPAWLAKLLSRPGGCPGHGPHRAHRQRLVRQLAERYARHPALASWQIDGPAEAFALPCPCVECSVAFRIWLKRRHESLDSLNAHWATPAWGLCFQSWEEIVPPPKIDGGTPGQLDYQRFISDSLLTCFLEEKEILREITPQIPITASLGRGHGRGKIINGFVWAGQVDFISFHAEADPIDADPTDLAFAYDLQRGLAGGRPWFLRQPASQSSGHAHHPVKRPGQMRLWSHQALGHGADAITFTQWRATDGGPDKFHSAMLPHGGTETRTFREAEELGRELEKLSVVCGSTTRAEVALVFDWENMWAVESASSPARVNYSELVRSYYRALFEPDVPIDLVPPEADFTNYKLVIAPALHLVRPGVAERLEAFVDNGGTLLITFTSGLVDEHGRILPGGHPGPFRKLLGLHVEEFDAFGSQLRHLKTPLRGARCMLWADLIQLEGAETLATFTEDFHAHRPAITRNAVGRGLAYYIGTQPDPSFLRAFLAEVCHDCGVRPPMRAPAGVEITTRSNEHGEFLFLLNHTNTIQFVDLGPRLRLDLLSEEMVEGQCQLAPRDARVLKLE